MPYCIFPVTVDEKVAIVMESFTSNNIAELCRRHGVSVSRLSKIAKIQRSYIYYNRKITAKHRKT